jgi:hypothetical protein
VLLKRADLSNFLPSDALWIVQWPIDRRELLERGFESSRKMTCAHMDARSNFLERELAG